MRKTYFISCNKYRKSKNAETSYIFDKTLFFSVVCDKCGSKDGKYLKKINQSRY